VLPLVSFQRTASMETSPVAVGADVIAKHRGRVERRDDVTDLEERPGKVVKRGEKWTRREKSVGEKEK